MKLIFLISAFLLSFSSLSVAQNKTSLAGTWKVISGTMKIGDTTTPYDLNKMESMKIVTPTHFAVFAKNKEDGTLQHAAAGKIIVSGNNYTEIINYMTGEQPRLPITAKFTSKLEGNKWHIKGGFENYVFDEVWERVK